jgi:hypothetical protein
LLGGLGGFHLGSGFGVYQARNCFDVSNESARLEFVGAYFLKLIPARRRFQIWMSNAGMGKYAKNFPQFIGLTGLQDTTDSVVKDAYLAALPSAQRDERGRYRNTGFAAAVAVSLGYANEEPNLRKFLDDAWESLTGPDHLRQPTLEDTGGLLLDRLRRGSPSGTPEDPMGALEYLACLALSWLRAKRYSDAGTLVDSDRLISYPPALAGWPAPTVPAAVTNAGVVPGLEGLGGGADIPLFSAPEGEFGGEPGGGEDRPSDASPTPPSAGPIEEQTINVPESAALVDPGIDIKLNDRVVIGASGTIWAGVWLRRSNGPEGWSKISNDSKFPARGTNPYCLLYKIVPQGAPENTVAWRKLGSRLAFAAYSTEVTGQLFLRTNDDKPGNGSGAFSCSVSITRAGP